MKKRTASAEKKSNRPKKSKRDVVLLVNVPKLIRFVVLLVMCALAVLSVIQIVKRVLPLRSYSVEGFSVYDSVEIFNASGLKLGELLYEIDEDAVEARILENCPYLSAVEVKAVFPTKLHISVEGRQARWYIDVASTKYALDGDMVVIDEIGNTEGLTKLILPHVKSVMAGEVPAFSESETELKKTVEILSQIRQSSFQTRLTEVNLENRWNISMVADGSYRILMGDGSDFASKLKAIETILGEHLPEGCVGGEIDVSMPQNPAFRPIFSPLELPQES